MNAQVPTLLCWHSHRAGAEVLEKSLKRLSVRKIKIQRVLYLVQLGKEPEKAPNIGDVEIEKIVVSLEDPTHHFAVYELLKEHVLPRVRGFEQLHINVSPGTPAMHTAWLVLHAGGAFPEGTQLWSSQYNRETKRTRIDPVDFPITTYLSEYRARSSRDSSVAVYDPQAKSPARREALERLARYARVPGAPLLLLGERGTGKTRTVETLVATVKGREKVVTVPCGGLDSSLVESVLFGHKKGAFTGATEDRMGLLAEADGGILFLDEVQDLPRAAQRKLIRVFQGRERRFRPVGGVEEVKVDVELVCASNVSREELRERLDEDFFDRISHLVVSIPPLRECQDDLREDWQRVWGEICLVGDMPTEAPWSDELEKAMQESGLPGNLRDLQRLGYLLMAWLPGMFQEQALGFALSEWDIGVVEEPADSRFGKGSRNERIRWFRKELAVWAKGQFGTWEKAAMSLLCNEKTLRDDFHR